MKTRSKTEAARRAGQSLDLIEHAQNTVATACEKLSRLIHVTEDYDELREIYGRLKATWHGLNGKVAGGCPDMDSWWKRDNPEPELAPPAAVAN